MTDSSTRSARFAALTKTRFDVVIIGGGIVGAGVARDAAMRGLSVALFEKSDFGSGTTANSTRLIHGGLRYLEMLDFRLVRMDLRERETLLRIAPHLVKPLEFIMPFYRRTRFHRLKIKLGMTLYDWLSYDKSLPRHRFLSASELKHLEPRLNQKDLQGAACYFDAQAFSPERLCIENIIDADAHAAKTFNYAEVTEALRDGERLAGVRVRDLLSDTREEIEVAARVVVNASGAWFDGVAQKLSTQTSTRIRTTKGIHIACPPVSNRAVVIFSPVDGRLMFVIPWLGLSWLGTTDTDFTSDPVTVRAIAADVEYVMRSVSSYFPSLESEKIYFSNAGVRALVKERGSESNVSRMHRVEDGAKSGARNLISILGGKITGYRAIAEEAVDAICAKLNVDAPCMTARTPLPGARGEINPSSVLCDGLDAEVVAHLFNLYGSRASEIINLAASCEHLRERLAPHAPDIAAQIVFAIRTEQCTRLVDFLLRRTLLGFTRNQGQSAAARVASLLARELDWSQTRADAEMQLYQDTIAQTQAFRDETSNA